MAGLTTSYCSNCIRHFEDLSVLQDKTISLVKIYEHNFYILKQKFVKQQYIPVHIYVTI